MRILFTTLLLFVAIMTGFGQNTSTLNYTLQGQLKDSISNETIPYANVSIYIEENTQRPIRMEVSDDNGKFSISVNAPGNYILNLEYVGKKPVNIPFTAEKTETRDLGTVLMNDSQLLDEVVVTSIVPLVKVDLDKITYNMEEDPESKTNNVLEMLKKVPMVTVDGEENIQLKGSSNFKIYMNGKPSNLISSNPKDVLRSMPANTIKNIEVITDPGARYDAEGVSGILNIITVDNSQMGGYTVSLNAGVNTFGGFNGGTYFSVKYGKIGLIGNFNYYNQRQPESESSSLRETYNNNDHKYLYRNGSNKQTADGIHGSAELSYEIDTLNLLNLTFSRYGGDADIKSKGYVEMLNAQQETAFKYDQSTRMKYGYGSTGIGLDYQRTFSNVKDRLLTASYRFDTSPNDMDSQTDILNPFGGNEYIQLPTKQFTDGSTDEHTVQLDFTTPIGDIHTIEAGVKYIRRINESNSGKSLFIDNQWVDTPSDADEFEHVQDIVAAYGGYSLHKGKWGLKAGARFEGTWLNAEFARNNDMNFKSNYTNVVPSVTATYQVKPMQSIRAGYNMRISRPGIWYLNPYINTTDSTNISFGNPELDAAKYHSFNLNYSYFNPKLNMNVNLSYRFSDNSVQSYSWLDNDILYTSYYNIGETKGLNLSVYLNWRPHPKFNIYANMSGEYSNIKSNADHTIGNSGFSAFMFGGAQYTMPWDLILSANGFYMRSSINLQGTNPSFYNYGLSLSKSLLDKRLNIRVYARNPFTSSFDYTSKQSTPAFHLESTNQMKQRQFGISASFRFGEMKTQIKKTQRGITNDDVMSGGSQGQSGSGDQPSGGGQ